MITEIRFLADARELALNWHLKERKTASYAELVKTFVDEHRWTLEQLEEAVELCVSEHVAEIAVTPAGIQINTATPRLRATA